jgi:hypothetical protein
MHNKDKVVQFSMQSFLWSHRKKTPNIATLAQSQHIFLTGFSLCMKKGQRDECTFFIG